MTTLSGMWALGFWLLATCAAEPPTASQKPPIEPPPAGSADIVADASVQYQTIIGWEAVAEAGQADFQQSWPIYRDSLMDLAIDLGITRLRVAAYAGIENPTDTFTEWQTGQIDYAAFRCPRVTVVNDNGDPNNINMASFHFSMLDHTIDNVVLPLRQRLAAIGESLYFTLNYIAPPRQTCAAPSYVHNNHAEYAEFILAIFLHMQQRYGFVPDAVEVVNEPENTRHWGSGTKIGQAMVTTGSRLQTFGFEPDFIAPSNAGVARSVQYFDQLIKVQGVQQYLTEIAYHRYDGVSMASLQAIGQRGQQYGVRTAMLEHIGSGHEDLYTDLTVAHVSSWEQFALAFGGTGPGRDAGGSYFRINVSDPANPVLSVNSRTKMLRQYFHFVRPGAIRIGASTTKPAFEPVAFINRDGTWVVVVKASAGGSFAVGGLPAGRYGVSYTTPDEAGVSLADVTITAIQAVPASIPRDGVVTIHRR